MTTVVVQREATWDERSAAEFEALSYYEDHVCGGCGGYLPQTLRLDVGRDVERMEVACEDCASIEIVRNQFHVRNRHGDEPGKPCGCEHQHFYVAKYLPLPDPE